jgi:hypothetical protein
MEQAFPAEHARPLKEGSDMRMYLTVLSLAMSTACSVAVLTPAFSEEYRGTAEQQMACTPDVWRLCFDQIPDVQPNHGMPAAKYAATLGAVPFGV